MATAMAQQPEMEEEYAQQEEEVQGGPTLIQALEAAGISASDIKKLAEAGLHTVEAVAYVTASDS